MGNITPRKITSSPSLFWTAKEPMIRPIQRGVGDDDDVKRIHNEKKSTQLIPWGYSFYFRLRK